MTMAAVSYTHLRAHETDSYLVCRLLLEKNHSKWWHPMNARRRTNENGDLPVGWLDKLVQTGFCGGGGMQGMLFHAGEREA